MAQYNVERVFDGNRPVYRRRAGSFILWLYKSLCIALQIFIFFCAWTLVYPRNVNYTQMTAILLPLYSALLFVLHRIYGSLNIGNNKVIDCCVAQGLSIVISDAVAIVLCSILLRNLFDPIILILMLFFQLLVALFWCISANKLYFRFNPPIRTAIVYSNELALDSIQEIRKHGQLFFIASVLNVQALEGKEFLLNELRKHEAVFLCGLDTQMRNDLLKFCIDNQICVYIRPSVSDVLISSAKRRYMFHVPVLTYDEHLVTSLYPIVKRTMDIVVASLMLILCAPIMLSIAIAIKVDDGGSVFYRQKRLTKNGKIFKIVKFRSMCMEAEKDGNARLASQGDSRITRVGCFIRATRLDELPQLINILKGEMSLVGPRPERPELVEQYINELPEFAMRLQVKAGLTGCAQVHGRYNTTPYDKLQMDLMYIADMSLFLDVKILMQTLLIILQKESTTGVVDHHQNRIATEDSLENNHYRSA